MDPHTALPSSLHGTYHRSHVPALVDSTVAGMNQYCFAATPLRLPRFTVKTPLGSIVLRPYGAPGLNPPFWAGDAHTLPAGYHHAARIAHAPCLDSRHAAPRKFRATAGLFIKCCWDCLISNRGDCGTKVPPQSPRHYMCMRLLHVRAVQ